MSKELLESAQNARLAEGYFKKYKNHIKAFEGSLVSKAMDISEHHIVQLGKQLDAWETYRQILEDNGSLNTLGELPKIALDVITATMSNSILPVIASTQTLEAQKQMIYFKNLRAENTKGNLTSGQTVVDPRTGMVTPKGYASNKIVAEVAATILAATVDYTFILAAFPVRSQFLKVTLENAAAVFAEDVGPRGSDKNIGSLLGAGVSGTINYRTGEVNLTFAAQQAVGAKVFVEYQQNLEEATDLPKMTSFLDQTQIEAQAYALKSVVGIFQQYALKKQFGESALDDMAMELTREINAEIGGDFISKYVAAAMVQLTLH